MTKDEKNRLREKARQEEIEALWRILGQTGKNEWTAGSDFNLILAVAKRLRKLAR